MSYFISVLETAYVNLRACFWKIFLFLQNKSVYSLHVFETVLLSNEATLLVLNESLGTTT